MKKALLLAITLTTSAWANAQSSFYKYVNEPNLAGSTFYSCFATNSGNVFAGSANNLLFESYMFFVRTTATGTVQQMRALPSNAYLNCAIQTTDGNTAYLGTVNDASFVGSLVLLKTDIVGNYQITKTYADPNYSFSARKMFQDAQNNFYIIANAFNSLTFQSSLCLIKTDASGNITDQKMFSPGFDLSAMDIIPTAGNGVLITGYTAGAGTESIALIKLNSSLNIDWSKLFSDPAVRYFHYDIKEKSSGNFILCGRYNDNVNPYSTLLLEIDNAGNQVWAKKYASVNGTSSHAYSLVLTSSGAVVAGGGIDTSPGNGPIMVISADANNGNLNWSKEINTGATKELIYEMQLTPSGDIIACGTRNSGGAMHKVNDSFDNCADVPYAVTETSVTLTISSINPVATGGSLVAGSWSETPIAFSTISDACLGLGMNETTASIEFSIYPNPVSNELNIKSNDQVTKVKIFDAFGKMVMDIQTGKATNLKLNTYGLSNGVYSLQLMSGDKISSRKFVKTN